jgi:CheY-like chemotaxis protein
MSTSVRVFVVDDEQIIAWSAGLILRSKGFETSTFTNPCEALQRATLDPPDLLITDVKMPEMSGIELAIRVKSRCPRCQILLLSGYAATIDLITDAKNHGHNFELLQKPVHPKDLLAAVDHSLVNV